MKWNWGTKIAAFYTSFVVFIIFMVYLAFGQKYDLVTEDYYVQEIAYQGTIDSKERTKELSRSLRTTVEGSQLKITFPHQGQAVSGTIHCFRPSDESKDFHEEFIAENGSYFIPLNKFIRGKYTLKIKWNILSGSERFEDGSATERSRSVRSGEKVKTKGTLAPDPTELIEVLGDLSSDSEELQVAANERSRSVRSEEAQQPSEFYQEQIVIIP